MLDRETRERLADYFDAHELVELLGLTTEEVIDAFEIEVEDAVEELEEIMGVMDRD